MPAEIIVYGYNADLTGSITQAAMPPFDISVGTLATAWSALVPAWGQFPAMIRHEAVTLTREGAAAGKLRVLERAMGGTTAAAHDALDPLERVVSMLSSDVPDERYISRSERDASGGVAGYDTFQAHTHPWSSITSKPATFPPDPHGHGWSEITSKPATFPPDPHTQDWSTVTGKPSTFAPSGHSHPQSEVTNLPGDLSALSTRLTTLELAPAGGFTWTAAVKQAADLTNATLTLINTDLVFTFVPNSTYAIDLYLLATAALATTGHSFAFDTSVAVNAIGLTFVHQLANTGTLTGGSSIADAAVAGRSSGVPGTALVPIMGSAILVSGASGGTARLQYAPEVAASATLKAGSAMRVHKVA